jgi:hypothetical protein
MVMKWPPPSPEDCGFTTPRQIIVAIIASTALPPRIKMSLNQGNEQPMNGMPANLRTQHVVGGHGRLAVLAKETRRMLRPLRQLQHVFKMQQFT